ncbi:MAG: hypothetical protein ACOCUD_01315 [Bacillota bacterium]
MKALKTKVILSGIVLIFAFIATIGTTFAWFTISTTATVESMELNVSAAENILIKIYQEGEETDSGASLINATNYRTTITEEDLIDAGYLYDNITGSLETEDLAYDTPWRLQPTTIIEPGYASVDAKTIHYIDDITNENRVLTDATPNDNGGHYIELKFWLLSQAETEQVIELNNVSITADNGGDNAADLNEVVNATRLAVWLDDTDYSTSYGGSDLEGDAFVYGLDIDYDYVFLPNIAGYSTTDSTLTDTDVYFNQLSDLDEGAAPLGNPVSSLPANHFDGAVSTQDLFTVQPGVPTLATVLIYIEGWDVDADNNIVKAQFSVSFQFRYGTVDE